MTGNMGAVAATFSTGDGSNDSGRWWIDSNQLCQRLFPLMDDFESAGRQEILLTIAAVTMVLALAVGTVEPGRAPLRGQR
jgi:hypothetical protein